MACLLGIDLGTSGVKAALYDLNGTLITSANEEYPLYEPKPGYAEQESVDWWNGTKAAIKKVLSSCGGYKNSDIKGIGLSGQMHGLVLLDKNGNPLTRSIIWCDQRTEHERAFIEKTAGKDKLIQITSNPAHTGFTLAKILWVRNNMPEIFEKAAHILLPKDYIRFKLTGEFISDVSDASGTQLLDVKNRCWSEELPGLFKIDRALLPHLVESSEEAGRVSRAAAEETGLCEGTVLAGGAGDQAAAAIGNGIIREGLISCNLGSSGVVFAHKDKPETDAEGRLHTFCHAVKGAWHMMGVTQGAGLSMRWLKNNFYPVGGYDEINKDISEENPAECGIYLPYLMGERCPHSDPFAKGVYFGITAGTTKAKLARAVMEGITFSLCDCFKIINSEAPENVKVSGGGSKSKVWMQMISDVFNSNVVPGADESAGALGVCALAGVAAGIFRNEGEAVRELVKNPGGILVPDTKRGEKYRKLFGVYKDLYPALKNSFKSYSNIN